MKTLLALAIFYWINLVAASVSLADYVYNLTASLEENSPITIEQQTHYYEMFHITSSGEATVTFDNYDANLISPYDNGEYSDPYLYLYLLQNTSVPSINGLSKTYILYDEDDDGNEEIAQGLYFYLPDVTFTNEMIAIVTSYDPLTTGTVDFNLYSDSPLTVIPEPYAVAFVLVGGATITLLRKRK
tara:strand:+ start:3370 stop:3927 length:558 start_codon:yes stop_codon:yes gene_type:complete